VTRVWRIVPRARLTDAFTGADAARRGARWNARGERVVYASSHLSLALLELLVHVDLERLHTAHVALPIDIPSDVATHVLDAAELPDDWQRPQNQACAHAGSAWIAAGKTAILDVPSAVIPFERNVALNPAHPDFRRLDFSHPGYPLHVDGRLVSLLSA